MELKVCFLGAVRRRTFICCRNIQISTSSAVRDRNRSATIQTMSLTRSLIPKEHRPILDQLPVRLSLRQGQPSGTLRTRSHRHSVSSRNIVRCRREAASVYPGDYDRVMLRMKTENSPNIAHVQGSHPDRSFPRILVLRPTVTARTTRRRGWFFEVFLGSMPHLLKRTPLDLPHTLR
jgi:hypothetical protein